MLESWWNRSRGPMLTRRSALLASAAFATSALPAAAQPKHATPAPRPAAGGRGGKKDQAATSTDPATTPIGAIDTAARWAFIQDYNTSASLLEKGADTRMPPSSMTKLMT